jgi:hypothetical protein
MDTDFIKKARAAAMEVRRRRQRILEFRKFCSAAAMVFTGLLMAAGYCLLTHQIAV